MSDCRAICRSTSRLVLLFHLDLTGLKQFSVNSYEKYESLMSRTERKKVEESTSDFKTPLTGMQHSGNYLLCIKEGT